MATHQQKTDKELEQSTDWLFHLFHSDELAKEIRPAICLAFSAGCLLHSKGGDQNMQVGRFICKRALDLVLGQTNGNTRKCQNVIRRLTGNEERFARAASSNLEINKGFNQRGEDA